MEGVVKCRFTKHEWEDSGVLFTNDEVTNVIDQLKNSERIVNAPWTSSQVTKLQETIKQKMSQLDMSKKKMLALCHGHGCKKLFQEILDEYQVVFLDMAESSFPDIVCDVLQHLHFFLPYGPFDAVSFIFAPTFVFSDYYVCEVVSQLVAKNGFVFFDPVSRSPNHVKCKKCATEQEWKPFLMEVKKRLYPNVNVADKQMYERKINSIENVNIPF